MRNTRAGRIPFSRGFRTHRDRRCMTGAAIALVLVSALLHATWNFFSKGSDDRWAFFLGQGVATVVAYGPICLWQWPGSIDVMGWVWIVGSAVTHAGYAIYLLKSYDAGD